MSKKLILLISAVLVLGLGAQASGDELLASYEDSEMADLTITTPGEPTLTVTRVLGGVSGAPAATDGSYVLKWEWTNETDLKITMRHEWTVRRLDLAPYNLFTVDVWYDEPNAVAPTIGIWDDIFGWAGALSVPTGLQQWHTVEMDANGLDANDVDHMSAFLFEDLAGAGGVLYTDNMWLLTAPQVTAWMEEPFDGAVSVDPNADLSWFAGIKADTHDVYFGTSFAEVNDATTSSAEFKGNQALGNTSYEPGTLEWLTSYYWRVDEVNTGEANSPWKGDIWSFKTDPELGYVEVPLVSYEDSETHYNVWASPAIAGDDFSLTLGDKLAGGSTWGTGPTAVTVPAASDGNNVLGLKWTNEQDLEVEHGYDFTVSSFTYDLSGIDEMAFDIYYAANDISGGFNPLPHSMGVFDWDFAPAFNGTSNLPETRGEWHTIVIDVSHLNNTGMDHILDFMFQGHGEDFRPDDEDSGNHGALVFMDNLRLRYAASAYASFPNPADGATGVALGADLSWRAGLYAASHDVYFGTAFNDVNDATTASAEFKVNQAITNESYDPGTLLADTPYYWRIDEINGPNTWQGAVWSFRTLDRLIVDYFDSYADTAALRAVWHDYWINGDTVTNAEVWVETDPLFTRDGNSMWFWYDNCCKKGGTYRGSGADADTADLICGSDWTAAGVKGLVLRYYGDAGNSITASDKMYVALEDASSNVGVVEHPDMNDFLVEDWREWNIDMEDFNALGLDLTNISKVYIGFGGPRVSQSSAGGSGRVYFDDIEVLKPRCVWWLAWPKGDFTRECVIDEWDLEIMGRDWLIGDYNVVGATPNSTGLVARYEFEGNVNDSNGSNHGSVIGAPAYPAGVSGQAISLDGILDYVKIPGSNTPGGAFDINDAITVAAWIKVAAFDTDYATIMSKGDDAWRLARNLNNDSLEFACTGVTSGSIFGHIVGGTSVDDSLWHHVAGVYDGSGLYLYIDGVLDAWDEATGLINSNSYEVYIGENAEATGRLWDGQLDDARVYSRGLSHSEIVSLAGLSEVYQPVISLANLSDDEARHSKIVNFKDYALMADNWLRELLFPF